MLKNSRRYVFLLLAVLVLAFLFYKFRNAISLEGFRWGLVGASLEQAHWSLLILSLIAIYACYALRALRWVRLCRPLGEAHFGNVYSATLMGFACTFLLGRAGEPVRPVLIARRDSLSISRMFGIYIVERVFDMAATAVIAIVALLMFERQQSAGPANDLVMKSARSAGAVLLAGLAAAVGFLVYFRYQGAAWLAARLNQTKWREGFRGKIVVLLQGFSEGLQGIQTWGDLVVASGYTAAHWVLVVLVYCWVIRAFPGSLSSIGLGAIVLVVAFTLVGSAAQLPVAGGGSQAATFLVLTLIFGVEKEPAAVASIVVWLVTFAACCLVGVPLLLREGWSMGELRRMVREKEQVGESQLLADAERAATPKERPR
ncbi:MAG TPA: lysylphosphatidylglycerol synthase transmembrane domain-containing protein [Candidatus Acidoferrum sp.]|nr:lysylphosphatidylglycerol synthase transmembrane domain-containing protein [Candidatus Acidoferrum sp.]